MQQASTIGPPDVQPPRLPLARVGRGYRAAIDAASAYIGATAPNPPVGCALLDREGRILVVAAHHRAGTPHAEARALQEAREKGLLAQAHTALVTLEPCNHTGRTPPCAEALRESPVEDIWVGVEDPHAIATGGIARLRQQPDGRNVYRLADYPALGAYRRDCEALIAPFARRVVTGRSWLTVKQALDVNGGMIPPAGRTTFTDHASLVLAHRLRRATDAIVTGIGTVLADRPRFNVRHVADHEPRAPRLLVICDRHGRTPPDYREAMTQAGFNVQVTDDIAGVPARLAAHGVNWAMVEAGPGLLREIDRLGLWDDWLTIQQHAAQPDTHDIRARGVSPLRFLTGLEHETPRYFEGAS